MMAEKLTTDSVSAEGKTQSKRIASIDWMRGIVMILMIIDHASMAFNGNRFSADSAGLFVPGTEVAAAEFITRWISPLCAPTFVFLAGTALAISIERRVSKGQDAWGIDKRILIRGFFILLLDPTVISFFSWRLTFQVLYAIGLSMMLMTLLRRLSTFWLVTVALGWIVLGELATGLLWNPDEGTASIPAALTMAMYYAPAFRIMYPLFPWLSMMCLGWAFGRYLNSYLSGQSKWPPQVLLLVTGLIGLGVFAVVRHLNGYGNMFLLREDSSWMQYLLMSKYPPSLGFTAGQLGLLCVILAALITIEPFIGVRKNGPLLVFGQTAMFFYLVHRIVLEGLAQWGGLRGQWGLRETYIAAGVFLVILYPMCLWYRSYKKAHPQSWTQFV
ncbi:MAG: DUF1624 domain-containing protein [Planctomycetota bacterium]|jgi:uncharacterized membrane protein